MNVLITGVSKGIGIELVKEFLNQGYIVYGITRQSSPLSIDDKNFHQIIFDWDDYTMLSNQLNSILTLERFDIVINNAGYLKSTAISKETLDQFLLHMKVNVWQVLELVRMLKSNDHLNVNAHIVNIGSMGGVQGVSKFEGLFSYSASKAALASLTECLDVEFRDESLSFNYLALGAVNTEMLKEAFPNYISQVNPQNMAKFIVAFSMGSGQLMSGKIIQVSKDDPNR